MILKWSLRHPEGTEAESEARVVRYDATVAMTVLEAGIWALKRRHCRSESIQQ